MNMNWYRLLQTLTATAALFIAIGLLALLFGGLDYLESRRMSGWASTPGTVTASEVYSAEFPGRVAFRAPAVRVAYAYQPGDHPLSGDRVGIDTVPPRADSAEGQRLLDQYPVGAAVTVYYDPVDPATAVLERDTPATAWIVAAQMFALGAVALGLRWLWRKRPYGE